jgi:hypothetical protein
VLNHEDAVGSRGDRCAGHDFDGLAGFESRTGPDFSRAELADYEDGRREILGAASETIACRTRKGRLVAVGNDGRGKRAAEAAQEVYGFGAASLRAE